MTNTLDLNSRRILVQVLINYFSLHQEWALDTTGANDSVAKLANPSFRVISCWIFFSAAWKTFFEIVLRDAASFGNLGLYFLVYFCLITARCGCNLLLLSWPSSKHRFTPEKLATVPVQFYILLLYARLYNFYHILLFLLFITFLDTCAWVLFLQSLYQNILVIFVIEFIKQRYLRSLIKNCTRTITQRLV